MSKGFVVRSATKTGRNRVIEDREQVQEREAERQSRREAGRNKAKRWAYEVGLNADQ
jgi:hypothetical protein